MRWNGPEVNSFLFSFDWMRNDACEVAVNPRGDSRVNSKISEVFNQSPDRDGFSLQITSVFTDTFFGKHNLPKMYSSLGRIKSILLAWIGTIFLTTNKNRK